MIRQKVSDRQPSTTKAFWIGADDVQVRLALISLYPNGRQVGAVPDCTYCAGRHPLTYWDRRAPRPIGNAELLEAQIDELRRE